MIEKITKIPGVKIVNGSMVTTEFFNMLEKKK